MSNDDARTVAREERSGVRLWRLIDDQILALHLAGHRREYIAAALGLTVARVGQVLLDPRTQKAIRLARERMLGSVLTEVQDRMVGLSIMALDNVERTILADMRDDDGNINFGSKAKRHQDHVSFELLSRIGFGRQERSEDRGGGIKLTPEGEQRLLTALEKANRVQEIYADAEVVDVEPDSSQDEPGRAREGKTG